MKSNNSIMTL